MKQCIFYNTNITVLAPEYVKILHYSRRTKLICVKKQKQKNLTIKILFHFVFYRHFFHRYVFFFFFNFITRKK